jgi:hypothetical protein
MYITLKEEIKYGEKNQNTQFPYLFSSEFSQRVSTAASNFCNSQRYSIFISRI